MQIKNTGIFTQDDRRQRIDEANRGFAKQMRYINTLSSTLASVTSNLSSLDSVVSANKVSCANAISALNASVASSISFHSASCASAISALNASAWSSISSLNASVVSCCSAVSARIGAVSRYSVSTIDYFANTFANAISAKADINTLSSMGRFEGYTLQPTDKSIMQWSGASRSSGAVNLYSIADYGVNREHTIKVIGGGMASVYTYSGETFDDYSATKILYSGDAMKIISTQFEDTVSSITRRMWVII